jgi:GT2 family glycosyltransferase
MDGPPSPIAPIPHDLELTPVSRHPIVLPERTIRAILDRPIPRAAPAARSKAPAISLILVTFNNLPISRLAIESALLNTADSDFELIAVDNGSSDGTRDYLASLAAVNSRVCLIANPRNAGFAAANNQGLSQARGEFLVLLNNDAIVPPRWDRHLLAHLTDPSVGLVGPVTNRIGNEAEIETDYHTYGQLLDFAAARHESHLGCAFTIRSAAMFCLAMRADTFEHLGPLDERFGLGLFEDDDYSLRAGRAGYRVLCADDTFVHHFGQSAFGDLVPTGQYGHLFDANRRSFESKWQIQWHPPARRARPKYDALVEAIRDAVRSHLPDDATVVVLSKGDGALCELGPRRTAWHFPQEAAGQYAGHYPANSAAALAHLEVLRARGARYLLVPASSLWWLTHYAEFGDYLRRDCTTIAETPACTIFALAPFMLPRSGAAHE